MTKLLLLPLALAIAFLAGASSSSAPAAAGVRPADDCMRKPAKVTRALQPERVVRVIRGPNARRPVCGGGFQVVSIIGPINGSCLWTFYDPYSNPRVWSHWDYCP
jgi:hypothetical protein